MKRLFILLLIMSFSGPAIADELPPFDGIIEPHELVEFSSQVPGILEEVNVARGSWVKRGQVIARLKSGVQRAAIKLTEARLAFGRRKMVRNEQLYKKQLISIHDKDEIETEIRLAELELSEANEQLALKTIKSTINGVVVERLGSPGEYVGEEPFITIAQINPLAVELVVPSMYYGAITKGDKATVQIAGPITGDFLARVLIVDKVIDAASSTFRVRLELPNPKHKLPAGLKCTVIF